MLKSHRMAEPFYSDNFRCALIAATIRKLSSKRPRRPVTLRAIQAVLYRLRQKRSDVPFWFKTYTHGPHCDDIPFQIDSLIADGMVRNRARTGENDYSLTPSAKSLLDKYRESLETMLPDLEKAIAETPRGITDNTQPQPTSTTPERKTPRRGEEKRAVRPAASSQTKAPRPRSHP